MYSRELRELEYVPRWAIIRCIKQQSVAEHSYFTAMYANKIAEIIGWDKKNPEEMHKLVTYALWHDIEESFMSDIPGPIKHGIINEELYDKFADNQCKKYWDKSKTDIAHPSYPYDRQVIQIVKCASTIEEFFYLLGEAQLGNRTIHNVIKASNQKAVAELKTLPFVCDCENKMHIRCKQREDKKREIIDYFDKMVKNHAVEQSSLISKLGFKG
jgi:5'-deoxynucleotidase|tara:strand:+ start:580 stop:1221 length:642 start_codon:yes stop_codon:yes gene_type:complete